MVNMNLCKFDIKDRWQGFTVKWEKRNWVTDVFLYGIQITAVLYSLVMIAEIIDMSYDFRDPYPLSCYEGMTIGGLIFRMLVKAGWLVLAYVSSSFSAIGESLNGILTEYYGCSSYFSAFP